MSTFELEELTIAAARAGLREGSMSAVGLTEGYLGRVEALNADLRAVLEVNPEATEIARGLDAELRTTGPRSPLHGLPILVKDNIDTADSMLTTAGSLALIGSRPPRDADCVRRLRDAGAVILGKTNLSEWANFRSTLSTSGWSARGGQARNPYVLDRSPCGSSSGSAAAVAANLALAALGTETDGSIVCPSSVCGVVGVKPTLGRVSTAGVIPIAHSQDVVGVHARTVEDAAAVLRVLATAPLGEPRATGLEGVRLGVLRQQFCGYSPAADALLGDALAVLEGRGAVVLDPVSLASADELATSGAELIVLYHEFHADLDAYLAARGDPQVGSLADVVAFNIAHRDEEMPCFAQEHMELAMQTGGLDTPAYLAALADCRRLGATEGIDASVRQHRLDALVSLTGGPAWVIDHLNGDHHLGSSSQPAAIAGYPAVTVPTGFVAELPVGITFSGPAGTEADLIAIAGAYETAAMARRVPRLLPTLPLAVTGP